MTISKNMEELRGTGVAIITPFSSDNSLDLVALRKTVNNCIEGGIDYIVVLGTTGETATLNPLEKQAVMDTVVAENKGRVPLVVGIGGNNTSQIAEELKNANLDNFTAVLSVSPYYNKPTQEGIYRHYKLLSEISPKPLIIYNVPGRTASNVLPATVARLSTDCPNIIGIKEASGDMAQVQKVIKTVRDGFMVISGDDFTALPTVLAGGEGVISVLAQATPVEFSKMIEMGLAGHDRAAYRLHQKLRTGMDLIFEEGNPAGIKAMLEHQNVASAAVRLPLVEASDHLKSRIGKYLDNLVKLPA